MNVTLTIPLEYADIDGNRPEPEWNDADGVTFTSPVTGNLRYAMVQMKQLFGDWLDPFVMEMMPIEFQDASQDSENVTLVFSIEPDKLAHYENLAQNLAQHWPDVQVALDQ